MPLPARILPASFVALFSLTEFGALAAAHSGAVDPITEGFKIATCCDPRAALNPNPNDLGKPAWTMAATSSSTQTTYSTGGLTLQQLTPD